MLEKFFVPISGLQLKLPEKDSRTAVFFLKKNLSSFVYNTLRLMEKNPTSLPDTRMILEGRSVAGLSIDDLIQVKHFGDAAKKLTEMVLSGKFTVDVPVLLELHDIVGREEALEWGVFRKSQVFVGDCAYIPPDASLVPGIISEGFAEIREIDDPVDRACNLFAFLAKTQPFFDCNKRTAMLMCNGLLLSEGIYPLFIPARLDAETSKAIDLLYEKGDAGKLEELFQLSSRIHYPEDIDYGARHQNSSSPAMRP